MKKVKVGRSYRFDPCLWDTMDPPVGVRRGLLHKGDTVMVANMPGCPRANTMGHCHIKSQEGEFLGLVSVNSLEVI